MPHPAAREPFIVKQTVALQLVQDLRYCTLLTPAGEELPVKLIPGVLRARKKGERLRPDRQEVARPQQLLRVRPGEQVTLVKRPLLPDTERQKKGGAVRKKNINLFSGPPPLAANQSFYANGIAGCHCLALGELELLPRPRLAILLPLDHAGITRHEPVGPERRQVRAVEGDERT